MAGRRPCIAGFLIAPLLLGACDSKHAAAGPACTVVTAALVNEKLGFGVADPNVDRGPAATVCTYDNPSNQSQAATVQLQTQATPDSFARGREGFANHGEPVSTVPGLGEEAYSASLSVADHTTSTLVARRGSLEVLVTATVPADQLPPLMRAILALV